MTTISPQDDWTPPHTRHLDADALWRIAEQYTDDLADQATLCAYAVQHNLDPDQFHDWCRTTRRTLRAAQQAALEDMVDTFDG